MTQNQPFRVLFETFGRMPSAHADVVNQEAFRELVGILEAPLAHPGGCTLLRAPRAGHGKTHLLSRLRHRFEASHDCILLRASGGYEIHAQSVLEDVLRHLFNADASGLHPLDQLARRLLAFGLQPLVESGQIPSEDRQSALSALREQPLQTLDFDQPYAMTAHWLRENFEVLSSRISAELALECGMPAREVRFWIERLYAYTTSEGSTAGRQQAFEQVIWAPGAGEATVMARLEALLGLMTLLKRVVLIADDLEGFSSDSSAALRFASFVMALRQSVQRLEFILSLNQDVWDAVFVPCLSDGLTDRLSERLIELNPLGDREMVALLECRVPGSGAALLSRIDRSRAGTHARGVIREAATAWQRRLSGQVDQAPAPMVVSAMPAAMPVSGVPEPRVEVPVVVSPPSPQPLPERGAAVVEPTGAQSEAEAVSLDPADRARVDEMLRQFRERYGQDRQ